MEPWEDELLWDDDFSDEEEDAEEQIEETGLELGIGRAEEPFEGIGRGTLNIEDSGMFPCAEYSKS